MNLLELFAKLSLDSSEYEDGLNKAEDKAESFGSKLKSGLASAAKITGAGIVAAGAAAVALTKSAVSAYADYEQLTGGIETLFKDSSDTVMKYAENAYKTAGLSANNYMELVTGFSASLINSVGGDTEKAASLANTAITDMADNANKMGTDIESLQNAYRGFSRGNFTMLDNLALGFSGSKEGMEELLAKAEELSGVKYDINSYADIVEAIHTVQTSMSISGLTAEEAAEKVASGAMTEEEAFEAMGTTAKEAATTISGSLNAAKGAITNLIAGLADGNANIDVLVANVVESVKTAFNNIAPAALQALSGISEVVLSLAPIIAQELPKVVSDLIPSVINAAMSLFDSLVSALPDLIAIIVEQIPNLLQMVVDGVLTQLPTIIELGLELIASLAMGIANSLPTLVPTIIDVILQIVEVLTSPDSINQLILAAKTLIFKLAEGLILALPTLLEGVFDIILNIVSELTNPESFAEMHKAGWELIKSLINALWEAIKGLGKALVNIGKKIIDFICGKDVKDESLEGGKQIGKSVESGIKESEPELKKAAENLGKSIPSSVGKGIEKNKDDAEKAAKDLFSRLQKEANRKIKFGKLSTESQIDIWTNIQNQFTRESEEWWSAEEKIFDLREKLQDEYIKKLESTEKKVEDFAKKVQSISNENDSVWNDYLSTVSDRAAEISKSYGSIFDAPPEREYISKNTLLKNIRNQTKAIEKFYSNIEKLAERGAPEKLVNEIRAMGVDASDELLALLGMSDWFFEQYISEYEKKEALSQSIAEKELETLKETTWQTINANLAAIEDLYEENAPEIGEMLTEGIAEGIREGSSEAINQAIETAKSIVRAVKDELGIASPSKVFKRIGSFMADGLKAGWNDSIKPFVKDIGKDLGVVSTSFADSGIGKAVQSTVNGLVFGLGDNNKNPVNINLNVDGHSIASVTYEPLKKMIRQKGDVSFA